MTLLSSVLTHLLPVIEADLQAVFVPPDNYPPLFYHILRYHMGWIDRDGLPVEADRGKRIRPALCLMVCEAVCGDPAEARPSAAAVELVHNFSLLHDDIQDRSPMRRSRPTVWAIWGEAQAINIGDALFALAHLAVPRLTPPGRHDGHVAQLLTILDETCLELTRGQYLDISFETHPDVSVDEYLNMVEGKTAALLSGAAHMGALSGGAQGEVLAHYAAFGRSLGLAFQVMDDVLDIWGNPARTGKRAASDIYQRKKSLPVLYGLARSEELRAMYAAPEPFGEAEASHVIHLLEQAGAVEYAEQLARDYSADTVHHLEAASPQGETGEILLELVESLLRRDR
jgi:geranylgeranyl diphosphate synthase type I